MLAIIALTLAAELAIYCRARAVGELYALSCAT